MTRPLIRQISSNLLIKLEPSIHTIKLHPGIDTWGMPTSSISLPPIPLTICQYHIPLLFSRVLVSHSIPNQCCSGGRRWNTFVRMQCVWFRMVVRSLYRVGYTPEQWSCDCWVISLPFFFVEGIQGWHFPFSRWRGSDDGHLHHGQVWVEGGRKSRRRLWWSWEGHFWLLLWVDQDLLLCHFVSWWY